MAVGQLAEAHGVRLEQRVLPTLAKLVRDPDAMVRQAAIEALGQIRSEKVIPLLQLGLRDGNVQVTRAATVAVNRFKMYRVGLPQSPQPQPPKKKA